MTKGVLANVEPVDVAMPGIVAFTTTRDRGDFNVLGDEPAGEAVGRWLSLQEELRVDRLAYARQVHGKRSVVHNDAWTGWLRVADADGHLALAPRTALAVTLADCVPIFVTHPVGWFGVLHAGWRGTAAGIVAAAMSALRQEGVAIEAARAHLGPAICGACYEVGPEVIKAVRGDIVDRPALLDLRAALGRQLRDQGVSEISVSPFCTRCNNSRFFSHRVGDAGRHIAVIARIA